MFGSELPFDSYPRRFRRGVALAVVWLAGSAVVYSAVFYVWHGHAPW